ncbi:MAG: type II toxin-antitoxin system HicA family toxin [Clostridiales Family XIII bacterium]|jgi:predicted RNA binding protein YcfA (HicA-like mRNA interferase family)|nr:type II toxin-antitoxin system HicA family toxin [Clostridiales Family XIII bacterium]
MTKIEKLIARAKRKPDDFTYQELVKLLNHLGYNEFNSGKTSGSQVNFYDERHKEFITIHKPHPHKEFRRGSLIAILKQLEEKGIL